MFHKLHLAVLAGLALVAQAVAQPADVPKPPSALTPDAEAAARAALEKTYGDTNTAKAPVRAVPNRITNAAVRTNAAGAAAPTDTPLAGQVVKPAAAAPQFPAPTAVRPATNNRVATVPGQAVTRPPTTATPVVPAAPQAPVPGQQNVAGQAAPANANTATAPGFAAGAAGAEGKNRDDEVFPPGLIKFVDSDLGQVLEIYQELTGRTVLKPSSLPATKITIKTQTELTRAEAVQALDSILSMNGITMIPQGTKFVKALAEAQAGGGAGELNDLPGELLPNSGTYVTHVIQLTNTSPNDIMPVLTPFSKAPNSILTIPSTGMLVLRDYAENVKRMLEMIAKVDVVPQQEFESVVIPIKYALAGDIATVLSGLTAGGGGATTIGGQRANTGLSGVGSGFGAGGAGGVSGAGGFGQPGYNPNNPNQLNNRLGATSGLGGSSGRSSFANRLQNIMNRSASGAGAGGGDIFVLGNTKIIADERINALLIFASKTDLVTISNIIDKLDVVLAQVLIEAIVMEVQLGNDLNYGFSYLQNGQKPTQIGDTLDVGLGALRNSGVPVVNAGSFGSLATNAAGALPGGFTYFAQFANFEATAAAFASSGKAKVLQRPRIQTSHAVEANLFVGETRPYPTGTSYGGFGGNYSSIQQLQIGVTLSVLPLINADGLVVMDIRQKIQDVGESVDIANVGKVPSTVDREANAKVAVRDRETVMLGGFISNSKSDSKSGIPILKDIPILGNLFRSTTTGNKRRELIVLIRPTVLPTPQDAATFAAEERAKLPGTRQAESEFEKSERKLLDDENKRQEKENRKIYKKEGFSK